jgi:hypothetical protein
LQSRDGRQQTQAARRLQDLSYEDPRAAARILEEGAAPHLVEVLTNGASLQAKVAAAGALVDVGGHGTSLRLEVTRAGAVEPAIALLDRDDDAAREVAAGLLVVAAPVARAAVVVPLVKMCGDTTSKASQIRAGNAAWALSRLADLPGLPLSMARAGAGEALKNALGAPRARRRAADAVTALAADEGVARELSDAGCGAALARALERTSATSDDMYSLVSALASLAEADPRNALNEEKPPLAALVRVLDRGHAESKREAARALYALATDSAEVRERLLFHHDAVLPLERLLDAADAKARVLAAAALRVLGAPPPAPPPPTEEPVKRKKRPSFVIVVLVLALGLVLKGKQRRRRPAASKKPMARDKNHEDMRNAMVRIRELTVERDEFKAKAEAAELRVKSREEELRTELAELREARRADAASLARSLASRARERKEAERRFEIEHDAAEAASAANAARAADRQRHGLALARERDAALRQLAVVRAELDAAKSQAKRGLFSSEDDPVLPMAAGGSLRIR